MKKIWIAGLALMVVICGQARMQAQMDMPAGSATSQGSPSKAFDAMLSNYEKEFMGAARAMPADKYDFAPQTASIPGSKFDGVRTFAEQAKHVAQANFYYFGMAGGMKPDTDVKAIATLKTKDEIVAALAASFAFGHKAFGTLTEKNAFETVKGPMSGTRATMAAAGVAHGFDHYGQLVEYLRMNGIIPPASAM
jgi:hypothetical protein